MGATGEAERARHTEERPPMAAIETPPYKPSGNLTLTSVLV